jgi:hypothetical protein
MGWSSPVGVHLDPVEVTSCEVQGELCYRRWIEAEVVEIDKWVIGTL